MSLYENPITDLAEAPKQNNLLKVAYVGVCFTSLFTAYIASQNLAAHLYTDLGFEGLGSACVLNIYCFLGIGSIFASHVKRSLSHKAGFLIGASCYALFVLAGLFTSYCKEIGSTSGVCAHNSVVAINIVATTFVGSGASILWLTQSDYVNQCADESTKGLYNGVFWSLMQMSQIIGSVLATILMKLTTTFNLYLVLFCFGLLSVVMFSFTPQINKSVPVPDDSTVEDFEPLSKSVKKFFRSLGDGKNIFMMMGMALIGISIAYYANYLSQIVEDVYVHNNFPAPVKPDDTASDAVKQFYNDYIADENGNVGYALIALAIGEVSAGLIVGRLGDAMKKTHVLQLCIVVAEVALGLSILGYQTNNLYIVFAAGYFWGFCDTGLNTIIGSIVGSYFGGALELFSLMRFLTGFGAAFGSLLALVIGLEDVMLYASIVAGTIGLLHVIFLISSRGLNFDKSAKQSLLPASQEIYN